MVEPRGYALNGTGLRIEAVHARSQSRNLGPEVTDGLRVEGRDGGHRGSDASRSWFLTRNLGSAKPCEPRVDSGYLAQEVEICVLGSNSETADHRCLFAA